MSNAMDSQVLDQSLCSSIKYNQLPHIDEAGKEVLNHVSARDHLLGMIASAGLSKIFSVHLIHKHFDIPEGRIMVYETISRGHHQAFQICSPRKAENCENLRGYFFRDTEAGKMQAYEYTTDPGMGADKYSAFITLFAGELFRMGVQDVFALTLKQSNPASQMHEFEMPEYGSTILVQDPSWLVDAANTGTSTSTDWGVATPGDGIVSLSDCTKTRSGKHHPVGSKCTKTRSEKHYKTGSMTCNGDKELTLDGRILARDSEAFAIISHAMDVIEAY
jgi:hypothetical protein